MITYDKHDAADGVRDSLERNSDLASWKVWFFLEVVNRICWLCVDFWTEKAGYLQLSHWNKGPHGESFPLMTAENR